MTATITKTTVALFAALFAAAFAMTGAAFAEDARLTDKLNAQIEASQAQIAQAVNATAQNRVSQLAAKKDKADEDSRAEKFDVASK